ncbi:MAG: hypothetical protein M3R00_00925, partial [Pseudomonadota bacterium]|nr:hypothetical protein [Pseudomonadota bacterium]
YMADLLAIQQENETAEAFTDRIAMAGFIIQHFDLEQFIEEYSHKNILTEAELAQRDARIQQFQFSVFANYLALFDSNQKYKDSSRTQHAVEALTYYSLFVASNIQMNDAHTSKISEVVEYLFANLMNIASANEDQADFGQLCQMLANYTFMDGGAKLVAAKIRNFRTLNESAAANVCENLLGILLQPILATESNEDYLNRISVVAAIYAMDDGLKGHRFAKMIHLVNAEQLIDCASADRRLTEDDFNLPYRIEMGQSQENALEEFVQTRAVYYFRALCRVIQYSAMETQNLVKQYCIVMEQAGECTDIQTQLVKNAFSQMTDAEIVKLVVDLPPERLLLVVKLNFDRISNFILTKKLNLTSLPNSFFVQLGKAIVTANHQSQFFVNAKQESYLYPFLLHIVSGIFTSLKKNSHNIALMISLIELILPSFGRCLMIEVDMQDNVGLLAQLIHSIPVVDKQYEKALRPILSNALFDLLTSTAFLSRFQKSKPNEHGEKLAIITCLLDGGGSLLKPQTISNESGKEATNSLLFLMKQKQFILLHRLLDYYRNNPQAIIDMNSENYYFDHSPLFVAISCGADKKLVMLMLELGFSRAAVDRILAEEYNSSIIKQAAELTANTQAMHALYIFNSKEAKSNTSQMLRGVVSSEPKSAEAELPQEEQESPSAFSPDI